MKKRRRGISQYGLHERASFVRVRQETERERARSAHRNGLTWSRCSNGLHLSRRKSSPKRGSTAVRWVLASSNAKLSVAGMTGCCCSVCPCNGGGGTIVALAGTGEDRVWRALGRFVLRWLRARLGEGDEALRFLFAEGTGVVVPDAGRRARVAERVWGIDEREQHFRRILSCADTTLRPSYLTTQVYSARCYDTNHVPCMVTFESGSAHGSVVV